jgi:hypothetical protein
MTELEIFLESLFHGSLFLFISTVIIMLLLLYLAYQVRTEPINTYCPECDSKRHNLLDFKIIGDTGIYHYSCKNCPCEFYL